MKSDKFKQSVNGSILLIIIVGVVYFLFHYLLISANSIVFQKPVLFEDANIIEKILIRYFIDEDDKFLETKEGKELNAINDELLVVYFWKNFCPCNLSVATHYNDLVNFYNNEIKTNDEMLVAIRESASKKEIGVNPKINFYIADMVSAIKSKNNDKNTLSLHKKSPPGELLPVSIVKLLLPYVEHTPSIAIISRNKGLVYYGPHQLGFLCNAETSIISKVISTFQQGIYSKNTNVIGEGCFCKAEK